jgi:hypothetical protein
MWEWEGLDVGVVWALLGECEGRKVGWRAGFYTCCGGVAEARGMVKMRYWHPTGIEDDAKMALDNKTQWATRR